MADQDDAAEAAAELGITPEEAAQLRPFSLPVIYASTFRLQGTGNDFNLILQRNLPAERADGSIHLSIGRLDTVATIVLSPQSLKDLHTLIGDQIAEYEKQFGEIQTPFLKRRSTKK